MGHAGGPEHVPVGFLDRALVAHHQGGEHAGQPGVRHLFEDRFPHPVPGLLHQVAPGLAQAPRRRVARAGPHVAGGLQALLPQPQLVVEAVRVDLAMRRLQPRRQLPALARPQVRRLRLQAEGAIAARFRAAVPAKQHLRRQRHRLAAGMGRLDLEAEAQAGLAALRHGGHHAGQQQVAAFQRRS